MIFSWPHSERRVVAAAVKLKTTVSLFVPVVLLSPASLAHFSLSSCQSPSALIAICAIIMARKWDSDWCLSRTVINKADAVACVARWEKIKQISDRIL